jgi:hypothetical protein
MPPSQPSPYRQLGSGGQQPVRVQMILGLVVGLVLIAVPLYLWRRPDSSAKGVKGAGSADSSAAVAQDGGVPYVPLIDASADAPKIKLEPFKTVRCSDPGLGKTPPERCDHITFFEDALARAVRENVVCAPPTKTGATVSFVLDLDFRRKQRKLNRGKSTTISKEQSKELFACIEKALPTPDWDSIPHQHARYIVNLTVTYPPGETF